MGKQENSLIANGVLILVVILAFVLLINLSARLNHSNLESLASLFELYNDLDSGENRRQGILKGLAILREKTYPGRPGEELTASLERVENLLRESPEDISRAKGEIALLFDQYRHILIYRDEVVRALLHFLLVAVGMQSLVFFHSLRRASRIRQSAEDRAEYFNRLQEMRERERQDLAADLHDRILQDLGEISLNLKEPELRRKMEGAIGNIRRITYRLVPVHLEGAGLADSLEELGREIFPPGGCRFIIGYHGFYDRDLSPEERLTLYRIAQESLNNVKKHARATEVRLTLDRKGDQIIMIISDRGRGFSKGKKKAASYKGGLGLFMMTLQAERIGAELSIESEEGQGT